MSHLSLHAAGKLAQHALEKGVRSGKPWDKQDKVHDKFQSVMNTPEEDFSFAGRKKLKDTAKSPKKSDLAKMLESDELKRLYQDEYTKRLPNYEKLKRGGRLYMSEVKARQKHLMWLAERYRAYSVKKEKTQSDRDAMARIIVEQDKLQKEIGSLFHVDKTDGSLLSVQETALYAHLRALSTYQKEYSTKHYISTPTRDEYMSEVLEAIGSGQSVLLSGETGTGKTLLAKEAIRTFLRSKSKNLPQVQEWYELDGSTFGEKLKNHNTSSEVAGILESAHEWLQKNPNTTYENFVSYYTSHVDTVSGHAGMTPREMVGGSAIRAVTDGQGGKTMDTLMILGPLLRAFVEGKPILIDEIDMIPNDTLMRIKSLLTSRPGESYRPQEDTGNEVILRGCQIIATRNGSGERYGRDPLDPAIMRLFASKPTIGYPPIHEQYEMIIARLMTRHQTIATATPDEIYSRDGILVRFTHAVEDIRTRFIAWEREKSSKNRDTLLKSDVIDPGIVNGWLDGYLAQVGKLSLTEYLQKQCLNWMLSIEDARSQTVVARILFAKGLIGDEDKHSITESVYGKGRKSDTTQDSAPDTLTKDWFVSDSNNKTQTRIQSPSDLDPRFVDPYELASLDPFSLYQFDKKESGNRVGVFISLLQEIGREATLVASICTELIQSHTGKQEITITPEQVAEILDALTSDDTSDGALQLTHKFAKIREVESKMSDEMKTRVSAIAEQVAESATSPDAQNTSSSYHERTGVARAVHSELLQSYAQDQEKLAKLNKIKVVEFSANTYPKKLTDPTTGNEIDGNQTNWDKIRAQFTHDKENLPTLIPALQYTDSTGKERYLCLLTVCHPDSGQPSSDSTVEYCKNHIQEDDTNTSYMSYGYAFKHLKNLPSKADYEAMGWTTDNVQWNRDFMRLMTYYGDGRQITKWYHPKVGYKDGSTQSSFWSSSPVGAGGACLVYADPDYARLSSTGRSYGYPSLTHL